MTGNHVPARVLDAYAAGETGIDADLLWAVESHVEGCGPCRERLSEAVSRRSPATVALVDRVRAGLDAQIEGSPRMPARGRWRPRTATSLLPRLAMTVVVVLIALIFDLTASQFPSLVLLLAPVAPLFGVAAAWSRGLDPAYELIVASPRAGLYLVLRRTLAVLLVVIPVLAAAGWLVGMSPARWLLPCLAFTAAALALGEVVGLHRAASGLVLVWMAAVVAPSLAAAHLSVLLEPASLPWWAGLTSVVGVVLVVRRGAYTALPSAR